MSRVCKEDAGAAGKAAPLKARRAGISLGGRKFLGLIVCVGAVTFLAARGADPSAFGAVALMYAAFCGGNAYIESKYAKPADA